MSNEETIEARAHAAGAAVRAATTSHTVPAVARVTGVPKVGDRRPIVWRTVAGLAAAAACVAAVVLVVRDDERDPLQPSATSGDARRVIDVLPEGFEAAGAVGPGNGVPPSEPQSIDVQPMWWITGPQAGQVASVMPRVFGEDQGELQSWLDEYTTGATEIDVAGHVGYLRNSSENGFEQARLLIVQTADGWLQVASRNIDDATLTAIGSAAMVDDLSTITPPSGFTLIGQAEPLWMAGLQTGAPTLPAGVCIVAYRSMTTVTVPDGSATNEDVILLTTTPDVRMAEAQMDLYFPDRSLVPGSAYYRAGFPASGGVEVLAWQVGGVGYLLLGTVSLDELVAAAGSVRVPTDDEWADLLALTAANTAEQSSTGSSVVVAPASTAVAVPETTGA